MTGYTVIGGSGFVGSHVVEQLRSAGSDPWCPGRDEPAMWQKDLGRVIYCAGLTGDFRARPFATVEAHVSLLVRLLERASFERIIYLSSTRVYDLLTDGAGSEDRPIPVNAADPEHLYELSKMLGENLTLGRSDGRGQVGRLSYVFGFGKRSQGFLSDWLRSASGSRSLTLDSSKEFARDYIHVDDVAQALIAMAGSEDSGIVNVARGESLSNEQIAALFARKGWDVEFSRESNSAYQPVPISTTKLSSLGITPRPVLPTIDKYLTELSRRLP